MKKSRDRTEKMIRMLRICLAIIREAPKPSKFLVQVHESIIKAVVNKERKYVNAVKAVIRGSFVYADE